MGKGFPAAASEVEHLLSVPRETPANVPLNVSLIRGGVSVRIYVPIPADAFPPFLHAMFFYEANVRPVLHILRIPIVPINSFPGLEPVMVNENVPVHQQLVSFFPEPYAEVYVVPAGQGVVHPADFFKILSSHYHGEPDEIAYFMPCRPWGAEHVLQSHDNVGNGTDGGYGRVAEEGKHLLEP